MLNRPEPIKIPPHFAVIDAHGRVHGDVVYATYYAAHRAAYWCKWTLGGEFRPVKFTASKS